MELPMSSPFQNPLEIPTSMCNVRRATTTGSVMSPAYGASARRARNSNQLDLFASLLIDPGETIAPKAGPDEEIKVDDGRANPLAGHDSEPLVPSPSADGGGSAQPQPAGASDLG